MLKRMSTKYGIRILILVGLLSALMPVSSPAQATALGVIFDNVNFTATSMPSGYTGSSDFPSCEFNRYSSDGDFYQHIYSDNDTCSPHTLGAPGFGDVSIYKRFDANPGEYYKAWTKGWMMFPNKSLAQVKLLFRNSSGPMIGECYGNRTSTSLETWHSGEVSYPPTGGPEISTSGGCKAPAGTASVTVHYRIHAKEAGASGRAVLRRLKFGRCWDSGSCSNVPAP